MSPSKPAQSRKTVDQVNARLIGAVLMVGLGTALTVAAFLSATKGMAASPPSTIPSTLTSSPANSADATDSSGPQTSHVRADGAAGRDRQQRS